ncbi:MAG: aldo/keto reductase [Anaerolineaceae bacterium]|nr:aldo/keto reductase [Anaerolineaceae bacterium]
MTTMKYRTFGKSKNKISILGFGCMRFPLIDVDSSHIDEEKSSEMLGYALDHGVNYYDTAYPYHGGESENFVGKFFAEQGGREEIHIATKYPSWLTKTADDFDRYLNEQLEKLQTDYIDYYLLHALNHDSWVKIRDLGVLSWAEKAMADGRIRELGFSFHDKYPVFEEIVDAYDWSFAQIQYNYMDIEEQAGIKGLQYAASKGMSMVVMEPIRGGRLANPPKGVADLWATSGKGSSAVDWALQWVWDQAEVSLLLSGMSTIEHVKENVASADKAGIGQLSESEQTLIEKVRDEYNSLSTIPCTDCKYCLPCTVEINIPRLFGMFNEARMYGTLEEARKGYARVDEDKQAAACIDCGICETKCPQHIIISDMMVKVDAVMAGGKSFDEV